MFSKTKPQPGRELVPVDDVVDNLPFIVRRDHRIVAAFARAIEWAELWSTMKAGSRCTLRPR